jgi:hypothetical protein
MVGNDSEYLGCNLCFSRIIASSSCEECHLEESHHWYCPWIIDGGIVGGIVSKLLSETEAEDDVASSNGNSMSKVLHASLILKKLFQ